MKASKPRVVRPVDGEIAKIESEVTAKAASESVESVHIPNWGTFYRRNDGWHGPGGFYGPSTLMAKKCEEVSQKDTEILVYYTEAMQRHHDYYVFLYREKNELLTEEIDRLNHELALKREVAGYVTPLSENAINYFKIEQEKPKESKG